MKKLFSTILLFLLTTIAVAQSQYFEFNVTTPGTLKSLLDAKGEKYIFDMKVTGNINAKDIYSLRDYNPALAFLDLTETAISECLFYAGTSNEYLSPANELPKSAFANSRGTSPLVSIKLPNTITAINESAFSGCTALTEIIFPTSVTTIRDGAFRGCTALRSINLPNSIKVIGDNAFAGCNGLTSLTIPNSVTSIGVKTIYICDGLTYLTIGNSVSFMSDQAIYDCTKLETITFLGVTPPEFESNRFFYLSSLENIYVPAASVAAYKASKIADLFYSKIKANPTDDINGITSGIKVYSARSEIIVEGTAAREIITLYSITGKQLKTVVSSGEKLTIPVDKQGIYLVKIGGKTYKVAWGQ